jgi:hypothetical protein
LEFEDVRIFDFLNPFNMNAHGLGLEWGDCLAAVSVEKESLKAKDLLEMEKVYKINPLFILKGYDPMFLDKI